MSRVQVSGLTFSYGSGPVLDEVSVEVEDRSLTAVIGPSGCGKTTLLRLLAGIERPASGTITIDDTVVAGDGFVPAHRRRVGLVPQEGALFPHLTVARNVALGLSRRDGATPARVEQLLDLAGLEKLADRLPRELSGGQQQRVALIRALAPRPRVVLLDEPFAALDTAVRSRLRRTVRDLLKAEGATAVLVTHDREETLTMADRVAVMLDGRVAQTGDPDDVYRHPASRQIATMLGEANLLPFEQHHGDEVDTALGRLRVCGPIETARGLVVVRPEQVALAEAAPDSAVTGRVTSTEFAGASRRVAIDVGGVDVVAQVPAGSGAPDGTVAVEVHGDVHPLGP